MRKRSRFRAFLDGAASIWPQPINMSWRYKDQFGSPEEQLRGEWQSIGDDMMRAIESVGDDMRDATEDEQGNDQEDPRP